jgi:hypothetical protein
MKNHLILMIIFAVCLFAAGCSTAGVPVEYSKACSSENDNKYIEVGGFLNGKTSVFCSNIGGGSVKCGFSFKESPTSEKDMGADIEVGTGANTVEELPKDYKSENVKIRDNNGNVINLADKVKLTGKLSVVPGSERCFMTVKKIEKQ